MQFTYRWLLEHVTTDLTPKEIGDRLTMAGLELDRLVDLKQGLEDVHVGVLESVAPHPNADSLTQCRVRVNDGTVLSIVCGATNHRIGNKVAVGRAGAQLPNGMNLQTTTIRGEISEGMLCSLAELGLATPDEITGIVIFPDETPLDASVAEYFFRNDWLFEIDLTPNRGDCLGVRGIARELAAVSDATLSSLSMVDFEENASVADRHPVSVEILDQAGCPRYLGRVIEGVSVTESPEWLRQRLTSVGLRSINIVVDITNYVLMDLGHPLHAFDLARIHSSSILVRRAVNGEKLKTLDGVDRLLDEETTVIADRDRPLALAGIMGGEMSGTELETTDIFLEAAYFDPIGIAKTGRRVGLLSDSRFRFERGVDPEGVRTALDRATQMILTWAGGPSCSAGPVIQVDTGLWRQPESIAFRFDRAARIGGIPLNPKAMTDALMRLGCRPLHQEVDVDQNYFQPPTFRHDLRAEEDLLEEVVRLHGYNRVASVLPAGPLSASETVIDASRRTQAFTRILERTRTILTGLGYLETLQYVFVGNRLHRHFFPKTEPINLINPLSEDQAFLRTSLIPGMVETARRNIRHGNTRLQLFETGRVFLKDSKNCIEERERVAMLLSGPREVRTWNLPERNVDFFDLKGDVETLFQELYGRLPELIPGGPDSLHPGRKAVVEPHGWLGELHPTVLEKLEIEPTIFVFEMDMMPQRANGGSSESTHAINRYPEAPRDFAFVLPKHVPAQTFLNALKETDPERIVRVTLFDLYTGAPLLKDQKSLAIHIVFQEKERTLTVSEIENLSEKIIQCGQTKFGAVLRSG